MKIKWNKIWSAIPFACAGACGGGLIGSAIGTPYMYIGAILAFAFIVYDNY